MIKITDSMRIEFMEKMRTGYGKGVILKLSSIGHGLRLKETSLSSAKPTIREAIDDVIKNCITGK